MKFALTLLSAVILLSDVSQAHTPVMRARTPVNIPDVPGYVTLKCDFHIHTIFSDGHVWPTVRAEEAWREGLDAIAITDHIEYQPHKADVNTNHNRSYEIARGTGKDLDVLVVKGSEITHKMPPGHLNAIFLTNSVSLATNDWRAELRIAHEQGAFIFWNHPGWDSQLKSNNVVWWPEHTWLREQGFLQGIEVVNGREYYPEAHRWAMEKKLTMMSNSDVHAPANLDYEMRDADHRPLTLVFATERTQAAIKEALFARRTVVYSGDKLIGDEQFLKPIFERSIRFNHTDVSLNGKEKILLQISNASDIAYDLERVGESGDIITPKTLTVPAGKTILFEIKSRDGKAMKESAFEPEYRVKNLLVGADDPLRVKLSLRVSVAGAKSEK
jgi:hypothetical protein